jgi:tRNA dimethylallyltransferase
VTPEIIGQPCLVLVGPTAIGKTDLSLILSRRYNSEIISVDSMQVYRYMDIGTAKATPAERGEVRHHLIDIVDPDENYDASMFAADGLRAIRDIHSRGKIPLLTGGSGLYLRALLEGIFPGAPADEDVRRMLQERLTAEGASKLHGELYLYDRKSAERIHINDTQRLLRALEVFHVSGVPWSQHIEAHQQQLPGVLFKNALQIGLTTDRTHLYQRINKRCEMMLENGLEEEVRRLIDLGYAPNLKALGSIGYRHIINYLQGRWSKDEAIRLLARDTRRYAKRQYTWFSKITSLQWIDIKQKNKILQIVDDWFSTQSLIKR